MTMGILTACGTGNVEKVAGAENTTANEEIVEEAETTTEDGGTASEEADDYDDLILIAGSEHHKGGSVHESNRNKHEKGQARKKQDAGNEGGDKRRKRYRQAISYSYDENGLFIGPMPAEEPELVGPVYQGPVCVAPVEPEYSFLDYCW